MMKPLLCVIALGAAIGFMLPSGGTNSPAPSPRQASGKASPVTGVTTDEPQETLLERRDNGHFYVTADVNGHPVNFVVDTGASMVALTVEDATKLGLEVDPASFTTVGRGASGDVRGQLVRLDEIDIEGKRVSHVAGAVVEDLDVSLLGQSYLSQIGSVQMSGEYMSLR